ncbi:MAG: hypothetical protein GVY32_09190 [Gammaproteobacteria bacterium]|jgi:protein tyrosine phosphatase (PTP) superfamily phosphohydrolase (DUF442 family)|nr:hypothetical protein [Gammaproteobacteria bacterium]
MKPASKFLLPILALLLSACATTPESPRWPDLQGASNPQHNRLVSGQPTPAELVELERAGVRHVVNARGIGEFEAWDEETLVESLGLQYHRVPIATPNDLDLEAVTAFDRVLERIGEDPAFLHCASGNRIGALYALRAGWIQGESPERAIAIGRAHGLTSLEATVREKLESDG